MSIEQVQIDIMNVALTVSTPAEEKETLLQAVDMLNKKSEAIKESGRIVGSDKIVIMAALNVVHDLLKTTFQDDLAIGEFERKIADMTQACDKALSRLDQQP
ncbi:cell division protein ZapA [Bergeriella denitrificans]|uniref:Z ring-associated protein ZapA n=1 Tax=Bergeriella denitrificans TaxID=494 RepID=A0A378UI56_BERDE|nr:cell division protein ZapA [Bergeriella denitrificans]STZ76985.1 Z ring-associated protein ZapA [Bergeriella denitrificans]